MSKSVIEQTFDCFNNQDLDGYMKFFHKEFKAYDLTTNKLMHEGIEEVYEVNKEPVLNKNKILFANNVIIKGNLEFFYKTFSYRDYGQTVIVELENELIKNVWATINK